MLVAASTLLLMGAWQDVALRRMPESLPLALGAIGMLLRAAEGHALGALFAAVLVFSAAVLAWRAGLLGGGDVKLLTAAAVLVPPAEVLPLLGHIGLAGGALALPYLLARVAAPLPDANWAGRVWAVERRRLARGGPLPYAVAIAAGCFATWSLGA